MFQYIYNTIMVQVVKNSYSVKFFNDHQQGSYQSAKIILPLVFKLIKPQSVVDVGCGNGTWLKAAMELGIKDILGLDGYITNPSLLQIPPKCFIKHDLINPLQIKKKFDLAISLEVAEHLPVNNAAKFIDLLTSLSPIVLFSAAIPHQGGTHHLNEQWPGYWQKLFVQKNYAPVDFIRNLVWNNEKVEWWYAQNTILYIRVDFLNKYPLLKKSINTNNISVNSLIHPGCFNKLVDNYPRTIKGLCKRLIYSVLISLNLIKIKDVIYLERV